MRLAGAPSRSASHAPIHHSVLAMDGCRRLLAEGATPATAARSRGMASTATVDAAIFLHPIISSPKHYALGRQGISAPPDRQGRQLLEGPWLPNESRTATGGHGEGEGMTAGGPPPPSSRTATVATASRRGERDPSKLLTRMWRHFRRRWGGRQGHQGGDVNIGEGWPGPGHERMIDLHVLLEPG